MKKVFVLLMLLITFSIDAQTYTGTIDGYHYYKLNIQTPEITDYQIVEAHNSKKLTEAVKILIIQGWIPYGAVAITFDPKCTYQYTYVQTMVKY